MYLNRLFLDPRSRAVQRDLSDCHNLHRTLLSAFPHTQVEEVGARATFGVLYRIEQGIHQIGVIVQSAARPDWGDLPPAYLLGRPAQKEIGATYAGLRTGALLRFRLRANPTRKLPARVLPEGNRNGKRVELRDEAAWLAWIARKGEEGGFLLAPSTLDPQRPNVLAIEQGKLHVNRRRGNNNEGERTHLTLAGVLFDGHLVVSDAERFRETLRQGIGSGKAYGFGLLSVARPGG